ncbi:unnamed protein product [Mytilus edulis]|uniref:Uncharacterized protein n=1 Tax=Mytilus edulis TaxID=6550 RepID=A0A8S3UYW7_MYTED|nr:unnamed protein product [Mytilus edulis]
MREGHDEIKRNYTKSAIQKEQLQKLVNEENLKHSKVRKDISDHKKAIKEQVDKHFNDLGNILDQRHANALLSLTTDLNYVSLFNTQTEDKAIEVQDFIQITDGSKFFRDVTKMERSLDIPIQQMQSSYISSPKFIPGNVSQSNIGSFKDDENLSMEPNISLVISNEYNGENIQYTTENQQLMWYGKIQIRYEENKLQYSTEKTQYTKEECQKHYG